MIAAEWVPGTTDLERLREAARSCRGKQRIHKKPSRTELLGTQHLLAEVTQILRGAGMLQLKQEVLFLVVDAVERNG